MKEIKERRERIYSFISKIMEIERYNWYSLRKKR